MKTLLIIDNVHMGMGHRGLAELAASKKVNPSDLNQGEVLIFINKKRDKVKVMTRKGEILAYWTLPEGRKISNLDAIQAIPKAFNGETIDFSRLSSLHKHLVKAPKVSDAPKALYCWLN